MNVDDKLIYLQSLNDKYLKDLKLSGLTLPSEAEFYLTLSSDKIKLLTATEASEAAIILFQAINFIQLDYNKHQINYNWCQRFLNYLTASEWNNVGTKYTPYEIKKMMVVKTNDVAEQIQKLITEISVYIDGLKDVIINLRSLANSFEKLSYNKKEYHVNN